MAITPNPLLQGTASQRRCAPPLAAPEQQRQALKLPFAAPVFIRLQE
jgi:hypothetical protein